MNAVIIEPRTQGVHQFRSDFVERWWTPVLGPSAMLLGRYIALELESVQLVGEPVAVDQEDAAWHLGLRERLFESAWNRLCLFSILHPTPRGFTFPLLIGGPTLRRQQQWPIEFQIEYDAEQTALELAQLGG